MKTYYDILEISRYASKEVLEKAHKVLIKRYHPDLETDSIKRKEKEEYIKKINEAYRVLSDEKERQEYDLKVFENEPQNNNIKDSSKEQVVDETISDELEYNIAQLEYDKLIDEELKKAQERIDEEEHIIKENLRKYEREYLRSLGYDVPEPTNWKRVGITALIILILIILIWLIYLIPPIKNSINTEIENETVIGFLFKIIKQVYIVFGSIIKSIFKRQ